MKKILPLSVHQLVDFLLRTGDIDNRIYNNATMSEGTLIHAFYQSRQGKNYISEYNLLEEFKAFDFDVVLEGRADGIIDLGSSAIIDEIKSTIAPLEEYYESQREWHLGQAKCYALMYAHEKKYDAISIRLTYIHQVDKSKLIKTFDYLTSELERDVGKLLEDYVEFFKILFDRKLKRNETAKNITFPYGKFRAGQKDLAKYTYGISQNGGILFAEAPTGIGKTVSTLFPVVKSFANTDIEKVFYLTAKNSGKEMAFNTANLLIESGLEASAIEILAKDKVCFCPGKACNPDECPYAKDYYTKIRQVIVDSIKNRKTFKTEEILEIAQHHALCPFELSLDLSLYMDIIICDYNYFFDPIVYLKRFFDSDASNMMVLVDEAYASFITSDVDYIAPLVNKYSNLIISRTLSKFYGLPGLRCGFGFIGKGHDQFLSYINKYLGFNRFSEAVALAALDSDEHYRRVAEDMEWGRQLYKKVLGDLPGFKVYKSVANFILIKYPLEIKDALMEALKVQDYKIKFMGDKGLESCLRITLGRKEQTQVVCDTIKRVFEEAKK